MFLAVIKQDSCIGCGICAAICPFDAIIGAKGYLHTVLVQNCIGCTRCVEPCPVDCIDLIKLNRSNIDKKQLIQIAKNRKNSKLLRENKLIDNPNLLPRQDIRQDLAKILGDKFNQN